MTLSDLKVGMILGNDGDKAIPLYHDNACTDPTGKSIAPGSLIGQIAEIIPGTQTVVFVDPSTTGNLQPASGNITDSATIPEKIMSYSLSWVLNDVRASAGVKFKDLNNNISAQDVKDAQAVLDANNQTEGLQPYIKSLAHDVGEDVAAGASGLFGSSFWIWGLAAGGLYLLSKSKTVRKL